MGTLCSELGKEDGALAKLSAGLFESLLSGLEAQFRLMGKGREARERAVHLLSAIQGASLLTLAFRDPRLIQREGSRLKEWVRSS